MKTIVAYLVIICVAGLYIYGLSQPIAEPTREMYNEEAVE